MAGKYRWCMIFLQVMIHKWEVKSRLTRPPKQAMPQRRSVDDSCSPYSFLLDIYGNPTTLGCQMDNRVRACLQAGEGRVSQRSTFFSPGTRNGWSQSLKC